MRFPRPRSLSGLIVLSFLLVSLPLLAGVVSAALQMTRLSESSERLVIYGVRGTEFSQALVRQVAAMERSARLYQLLGKPELRSVFNENRDRMWGVLAEMEALPGDEARDEITASIRRISSEIADALNGGDNEAMNEALDDFAGLWEATGEFSSLANRQIDRELRSIQEETESARRRLLLQTAALVPVSLVLTLAFGVLLGRPLRDIDSAISDLGHGRLDRKVKVRGPTDLRALGGQIEWLRQRLQEVTEERERFLRHMSHELKTPLATLREGAELLRDGSVGQLTKEQSEVTDIMREHSLQLQRLIENLLSYSAWQAHAGELSVTEFSVPALVKSVVDSHRLALATAALEPEEQIEDFRIEADEGKIKLVLDNLLSNAIKYSPKGGKLILRARRIDDEYCVLEVADFGPGIRPEERSRVFEAFYQGDTSPRGYLPGTGIGLSIVEEFITAHGGKVELVENEFPGAHFRVCLPMRQSV